MIKYKLGDVTNPELDRITIIVHCCNDIGVMGGGVAAALRNKWPEVYNSYHRWYSWVEVPNKDDWPFQYDPFVLGQIQMVYVDKHTWVCNLIGQRDVKSCLGLPPVRYEAIREGLRRLAYTLCGEHGSKPYPLYTDFNIVMPRMGAGLAGGEWGKISAIVNEELKDFDVVVYDNVAIEGTYYEGTGFYWEPKKGKPTYPVSGAEQLEFGGQSKP